MLMQFAHTAALTATHTATHASTHTATHTATRTAYNVDAKLIERNLPPRGGFLFTMFPHQEL